MAVKCCVPKSKGCSKGMLFEGESHSALYMEADMFISMAITYLILAIITGDLGCWPETQHGLKGVFLRFFGYFGSLAPDDRRTIIS
jgi:hypothetical protein